MFSTNNEPDAFTAEEMEAVIKALKTDKRAVVLITTYMDKSRGIGTMTLEEIQKVIEGMLAVQQELQNSQLRFAESLIELRQEIADLKGATSSLNEISARHERRIEQLIGYSISGEADRVDVSQQIQNLERRVNRLEQNSDR